MSDIKTKIKFSDISTESNANPKVYKTTKFLDKITTNAIMVLAFETIERLKGAISIHNDVEFSRCFFGKEADKVEPSLYLNIEVVQEQIENVVEKIFIESSIKDLESNFYDKRILMLDCCIACNTDRKTMQESDLINEVKSSIIEALKACAEKDSNGIGEVCKRKITQAVKGLQKWQE